jgi:hypothetical protein
MTTRQFNEDDFWRLLAFLTAIAITILLIHIQL